MSTPAYDLLAVRPGAVGKKIMLAPDKKELTPEERRKRRQLRREKQRTDNVRRAAMMHTARRKMEAEGQKTLP